MSNTDATERREGSTPTQHLQSVISRATVVQLGEYQWVNNRTETIIVAREENADAVDSFRRHLRVVDDHDTAYSRLHHCACMTEYKILFIHGEEVLADLSIQHGTQLRWRNVWQGDPSLLPECLHAVAQWLADRGLLGPKTTLEESRLEAEHDTREKLLASSAMPSLLRDCFHDTEDGGLETVGERLLVVASSIGLKPRDLAFLLLRPLGVSNLDWWGAGLIEQTVEKALTHIDQAAVIEALDAGLLDGDRLTVRGAARLYLGPPYKKDGTPLSATYVPTLERRLVALDVLQRARASQLRQLAAQLLGKWVSMLPSAELQQRVLALLADPNEIVRHTAMLVAGKCRWSFALAVLEDTLAGKPPASKALPPVPEIEEYIGHDYADDVFNGASLAEVAGLALGYLQHEVARPHLQALALDGSPMYDVALALMGEVGRLTPSHFGAECSRDATRNQALQLAAVEAVVRCEGCTGLEMVAKYQRASNWWEEERVMTQVSIMLVRNAAPGADTLLGATKVAALESWLAEYGPDYLGPWARRKAAMALWATTHATRRMN